MAGGVPGAAFAVLGLCLPLVRAVTEEGYDVPTEVQGRAIPAILDGRDLLACAQTGTGKTAAFVLPTLQRLAAAKAPREARRPRALVVTPTRELAAQIGERTAAYGRHLGINHAVIYGGVSQRAQEQALARGVDVLIATPGRLLDLLQQGVVDLRRVSVLVLDEADRMLDMGFIRDVRRIVAAVAADRQTLLFSATMPASVLDLARSMQRDPLRIDVTPDTTTPVLVTQRLYHVDSTAKRGLLQRILDSEGVDRAIVFTRTKRGANRLCEQLERSGVSAAPIHGNKSQGARERALDGFRRGITRVLVATDLAARGLDVDGISHVVNFDMPQDPESYVHRIGRTGRAGSTGIAISFCGREERPLLADIERLLRHRIPVQADAGGSLPDAPAQSSSAAGLPAASMPERPVAPARDHRMPGESRRRHRGARLFR